MNTNLFHVISITNIGSCFGSTEPTTINKATGKFWGANFPALEVSDWVKSQKMLMDVLKIKTWLAVVEEVSAACRQWNGQFHILTV